MYKQQENADILCENSKDSVENQQLEANCIFYTAKTLFLFSVLEFQTAVKATYFMFRNALDFRHPCTCFVSIIFPTDSYINC